MTRTSQAAAEDVVASARVELVPSLDALRPEWTALANESGNVFSTWEWASTWIRCRDEEPSLLVYVCRDRHGAITAILPLYLWAARPLRVARFLGHGPADQLGPVCSRDNRVLAALTLERACREARLDLLLAELLPGGDDWPSVLGEGALHREASPTLSLPAGWDGFLAARSRNFRQQVRSRERRLSRRYSLEFRLALEPERLQDDLTLLFALHRARWGENSPFARWETFHRSFAELALDRGWLRLWFLELDGRAAAAWYGFRFAGVESYYQAGRDPRRSDSSVGFVLLAHTIRAAAGDGVREYRLLRGGEPFKQRFADADPGLETLALAHGPRGRAARVAAAVALRSSGLRSVLGRLARPEAG